MIKSIKNQKIYLFFFILLFTGLSCKKDEEQKNELIGTWYKVSNHYETTINFTSNTFEFKKIHTTNNYVTDILKANYTILKEGLIKADITYSEHDGNTNFNEIGTKDTMFCQVLAPGVLSYDEYVYGKRRRIKGNSNSLANSTYYSYYEDLEIPGTYNHFAMEFKENEILYYVINNTNPTEIPSEWGDPTTTSQVQIFDKYYIETYESGTEETMLYVIFGNKLYLSSTSENYAKQ